jgi:hypothetical protein
MNWWQWYLFGGLLVSILMIAWDGYASFRQRWPHSPLDQLKALGIWTLAICAVTTVWPIALVIQLKDIATHVADPPARFKAFRVSRKHLLKQLSVQDAEELEIVKDPLNCVPNVPFGFLNHAWHNFITHLSPMDTLWAFTAREICGFRMEERDGYAIVRFGWIRRTMFTSHIEISVEK